MGKLANKTVYLIGPIDRCPERGASWRAFLEPYLTERFGCNVYNPLNKPIDIGLETPERIANRKRLKAAGMYDVFSEEIKDIRRVDLRMCDKADFAVCYLDLTIPICGTYEELFWLNRAKKPVIVFCKQGKIGIPDWLFGTLPHQLFFDDIDQVITYLEGIDNGTNTNYMGRWMFFDR